MSEPTVCSDVVVDVVERLSAHPLYQLSTAGQEQFHTNMLYWLIKSHPRSSGPLMREVFGIEPPQQHIHTVEVRREWRHVDLFVDSGMAAGKLVLENKLHSVPSLGQLRDYHADMPDQYRTDETEYVLLALVEPLFAMPAPWRFVDYAQLVRPLQVCAELLGVDGETFASDLVAQYADLIERLLAVRDAYRVDPDLRRLVSIAPPERERLRAARLLPFVEKLRASGLAALVQQRVDPTLQVGTGLTNTHGSVSLFVRASNGHHFGWQYQAGQVRLAIVLDGADGSWSGRRSARESYVEAHFPDYFDFGDTDGLLGAYIGRGKDWLGYEPDFVYRYRPISPDADFARLATVCAALSRHAQDYVSALDGRRDT